MRLVSVSVHCSCNSKAAVLIPITSTWPHLRCDLGMGGRKGKLTEIYLCYSIVCYYNGIRALLTGRLTGSGFYRIWFSSLPSKHFCMLGFMVLCILFFIIWHSLFYFAASWAWWDRPLTWSTNLWVLWHWWLAHLTRKVIPEMTSYVWSGTLNPTTAVECCSVVWFHGGGSPGGPRSRGQQIGDG